MKLNEKLTQDIRNLIGNLSNLSTSDKSSIVNAIKEINNKGIFILWTGNLTDINQTITLSDSYKNYNALIVCIRMDAGRQDFFRMNNQFIPVKLIEGSNDNLTMYVPITVGDQKLLTYTISNENQITTNENFSYYYALMAVYGLKI